MNEHDFELFSYDDFDDDFLEHVGRSKLDGAPGPGSGRYPLGSGDDPNQHRGDLLSRVKEYRRLGFNELDIATACGFKNTNDFRQVYSNATAQYKADRLATARAMLADGKTKAQVARELGISDSTLRSILDSKRKARADASKVTADFLKEKVKELGMIDVGHGVEHELGISRTKLDNVLKMLEEEGYPTYSGSVKENQYANRKTNTKILCPPGTEHREIYEYDRINSVTDYKVRQDQNGQETVERGFEFPASLDSKRLQILYRDDLNTDGHKSVDRDGLIEIRRGVPDLDLGNSNYAQVRILVDGNRYMKGMAVYADDLPDGVDVRFNTNKTSRDKALKEITDDPKNPFGSNLREEGGQYHYTDPETGERKLGLVNKTKTEGDWEKWDDKLASQFLSKQSPELIKKQIDISVADKKLEYEEILSVNNPVIKRKMLMDFANQADADAVDLQAASLPRAKYQVILPVPSLGDNEIYAPNFKDGETVALVRFPHGGIFEIPILTVNNKNKAGEKVMGKTPNDAVGINPNVASTLSGADFDGDTVMVIPCNSRYTDTKINSMPPLKGLEGFDTRLEYGPSDEKRNANGDIVKCYRDGKWYKPMAKASIEKQMGSVSNLITDMTLKGADTEELARAVRHSMVVIDAYKHKLDYRQSEIDNGIAALKKKYQGYIDSEGNFVGGASTLLSRAGAPYRIPKRQGSPRIDPDTGELVYKESKDAHYVDKKTGKEKIRTQESVQMREVSDARILSSGTAKEELYADYANAMKAMANEARKEYLRTKNTPYDKTARKTYDKEVKELDALLVRATMNDPKERKATIATRVEVDAVVKANPGMSKAEISKYATKAKERNRQLFNANRKAVRIDITPEQWTAIQSGAITSSKLSNILKYADMDKVKGYAVPKARTTLTPAKQARIKALGASGYTNSQIATALGISTTTVNKYLKGE